MKAKLKQSPKSEEALPEPSHAPIFGLTAMVKDATQRMMAKIPTTATLPYLLAVATLWCLPPFCASASAYPPISYNASGTLLRQIFLNGTLHAASTNNFKIEVRDQSIRIETWNIPNKGTVKTKGYEFITDGSISYFVTRFDLDTDAIEKSQVPKGDRIYSSFVDVSTNTQPPVDLGYMGALWLALGSGTTLKNQDQNGGDIRPEIFMTPDWPDFDSTTLKATWILSDAPPNLPTYLVESADAHAFSVVNGFFKRWKQIEFPAVYAGGYTNAIFDASQPIVQNGLQFPTHFRFVGYIPATNGSSNRQLQIQAIFEGIVNSVETTNLQPVTMPGNFQKWSRINEYRFGTMNGKPITYTSASGALLSKDEVIRLDYQYNQVISKVNISAEKHRKIIVALICFLFFAPLCVVVYLTFAKKRN